MAPISISPSPGRPSKFATGHVRSASVPCHSHPLLMHVENQVLVLRSWITNPGPNPLSLAHVRAVLAVLDELLHLPLAHSALESAAFTDRLLDGFLILADAYGSFLAALVVLKQQVSELQAAVRRHDHAKLTSTVRSQRQTEKELGHLASAVAREATRCTKAGMPSSDVSEFEVTRTLAEAINATAAASAAVFLGVASLSEAAVASSSKKRPALVSLSKKAASDEEKEMVALEKLQELEECIGELESESEKVFRSLVQSRVSLLNIHTPTF